jgi:hypothetical protein
MVDDSSTNRPRQCFHLFLFGAPLAFWLGILSAIQVPVLEMPQSPNTIRLWAYHIMQPDRHEASLI